MRGLALALLLAGCSAAGQQGCRVDTVADLPLLAGRRIPAVEATLEHQKVVLYVDTGAATSIISRSAAERFGLIGGPESGLVALTGVGGSVFAHLATIRRLGLGHGFARDIELPVAGELGPPVQGMPVLGLFGADFLANYDVDLDMPAHRFAMYSPHGCDAVRPFDPPYFELPFRLEQTKVELDLKLDDTPLTAVLDSGAVITTVTEEDARRAGITDRKLSLDLAGHAVGIDENRLGARLHRFGSLEIGDERMNNFPFSVADLATPDTLLGDDFLHFNRVWISYGRRRLYIQPSFSDPRVHPVPPPAATATPRPPAT